MNTNNIDSKLLYQSLKSKGIKNLYHANTVKTSLTFIRRNALLSRHYVQFNNLIQTPQYTDAMDKKFGIWNSVFLDGTDLHNHFGVNFYGPVLFVMNINLLLDASFSDIKITKSNPSNWSEPRFYNSIEEFSSNYFFDSKFDKVKDGGIMFLVNKTEAKLSLKNFCEKIILDDPKVITTSGENIFDLVKKTLETALYESNLTSIMVEKRHSLADSHYCYWYYKNLLPHKRSKFDELFSKS